MVRMRILVKMNSDSGKVNTDSGNYPKSVHVQPESAFTLDQNGCSHSARIGVHVEPEYAENNEDQNGLESLARSIALSLGYAGRIH